MLAVNTCNGLNRCLFWTTYNSRVFFSSSAFRHDQKVHAHTSRSTTHLPAFIPLLKPLNLQASNRNQIMKPCSKQNLTTESSVSISVNEVRTVQQKILKVRSREETEGKSSVCEIWCRTPSESNF